MPARRLVQRGVGDASGALRHRSEGRSPGSQPQRVQARSERFDRGIAIGRWCSVDHGDPRRFRCNSSGLTPYPPGTDQSSPSCALCMDGEDLGRWCLPRDTTHPRDVIACHEQSADREHPRPVAASRRALLDGAVGALTPPGGSARVHIRGPLEPKGMRRRRRVRASRRPRCEVTDVPCCSGSHHSAPRRPLFAMHLTGKDAVRIWQTGCSHWSSGVRASMARADRRRRATGDDGATRRCHVRDRWTSSAALRPAGPLARQPQRCEPTQASHTSFSSGAVVICTRSPAADRTKVGE